MNLHFVLWTFEIVHVNGGWSHWSGLLKHHKCSVTCGGGVKNITRSCSNPHPANGGQNCQGPSTMTVACKTEPCPVNSVWSTWHDESLCSVTCGRGVRTRFRSCHDSTHYHHYNCPGPSTKTEFCIRRPCPVNSVWLTWHDGSLCSVTCGRGVRTRVRSCHDSTHHHYNCPGPSTKIEFCMRSPCPGTCRFKK